MITDFSTPRKVGVWFPQGFSNLYHALSDIRAADPHGRFKLVCSHPHAQFVGRVAADVEVDEPRDDKAFLKFATRLIREHGIKLVVPSRRQALFNRHAALWASMGVTVLTVSDTRTLRSIDDKVALYRRLEKLGIVRIPRFSAFDSLEQFDAGYARLGADGARLCIKPAHGVYGSGFRVLTEQPESMADLLGESLTLSVASLRARLGVDPGAQMLLMQYLDGSERSVDCLADNGRLLAHVTRRKSSSAVAGQVIEDHPELTAQVQTLVRELRLNGLFNVQFKDHQGEAYLLEINTRMSGRSYYATVAGCNLPALACRHFIDGPLELPVGIPVAYGLAIGNVNQAVVVPSRAANGTSSGRESA